MQPKRVLIVDDVSEVRQVLGRLMTRSGHEAVITASGQEALEQVDAGIDLVILDAMMPGLEGFEVARRIRHRPDTCRIPILMLTALNSPADRIRAVEAGVNDFLAKPFDAMELRVRTRSLLEMKAAQDALQEHHARLEATVAQRSAALTEALREMAESRQRLHEAHLETMHRLAAAAEYKDTDTGAHIERVGEYCALLGHRLGLPDPQVEILRRASPLHDVGKIGIPDAILLKKGRLTAEEREAMQQHTLFGADILGGSRSAVLRAAETIALTHHEWWDGSGYPRGRSGEDIHLFGRICAVADVFDALTTERPYKRAFTLEEAEETMRTRHEGQFTPGFLDHFFAERPAIRSIQARFRDQDGTRTRRCYPTPRAVPALAYA